MLLPALMMGQSSITSLKKLLDSTRKERNDSLRIELNSLFYNQFERYISQPGFIPDSLKSLRIGQTKPSDGAFVFYNWNIQQNDGQNIYCGLIYKTNTAKVIELPIKPSQKKIKSDSIYTANDWPGALYYKAISPKRKTDNFYLLIAWDRFEHQTSRKSLEAITFPNDSSVVFGKEVFKTKDGFASRIVIEYAATANLTLNYSKQKLTLTGVRKSQSKVNDSIIIVDRLMPLNENLEGQRWAYVPVGNIYDGYVYFKGYWTFVEGINARNPALKKEDRKKIKKPDLDLLPH